MSDLKTKPLGPLEFDTRIGSGIIWNADGEVVANVAPDDTQERPDGRIREVLSKERQRLGHLFAAAPDLLAACEYAMARLGDYEDARPEAYKALREAVNKATRTRPTEGGPKDEQR